MRRQAGKETSQSDYLPDLRGKRKRSGDGVLLAAEEAVNDECHFIPGVIFEFYLGVTHCPPGIARGAYDVATRGTGIMVTCWPKPVNQLRPLPWNHYRGVPYWNQEMVILAKEFSPQIAARLAFEKLWRTLQQIPEEEAIADECEMAVRVAQKNPKRCYAKSSYASVFCGHDEHRRCKQIDCDCECHEVNA